MPSLNVFSGNAFNVYEMTASINRAPYQAGRIGAMGLFRKKPIRTTQVSLERKGGTIALLPSKPRGSKGTLHPHAKRNARIFTVPHIPYDDAILADDIQNVRAWESESELESVANVVNERLEEMRQNHEITHEYHRVGAIQGVIKDGDGSTTLIDLFAEFGISRTQVDFLLGTGTTNMKAKVEAVRRYIEAGLGMLTYTGLAGICGDGFWDKFIQHEDVAKAYDRWNEGQFFRESQRQLGGFEYLGVYWENYRGKVGDVDFIPSNTCQFVPLGVADLFIEHYAPADTMGAVNTPGQPVYAMQQVKDFDKGVDIHTQSNPLMLATRPEILVEGITSN